MADESVAALARVLVDYSTSVREGDLVTIEAHEAAAPLVRAVYGAVLDAGGYPSVRMAVDGVSELLLGKGTDEQLEWVNPSRIEEMDRIDARIVLEADANTRSLTRVDPARQASLSRARENLRNRFLERAAAGDLRWVVTVFPTNALAQEAAMSLAEYERFVYAAGWLDRADPVADWRAFGERLTRLADVLATKSDVRVVADGTDLRIGVEGRTWIPCGGTENFPDGEVFTGPVETSVEGEIAFSYPAAFQGRVVEGIRLRFEHGDVVEASAERGEAFLHEMLAMDAGARRVGEFAFGLNDAITEFTSNTLFDEKIGGTVHLAVGLSYPETGGVNESAVHWDMICDLRRGGRLSADAEVLLEDGTFAP